MALPESSPLDEALAKIIGQPSSSPGTSDTALVPKSSLLSYAPDALSYFQGSGPKVTLGARQPVTPVEPIAADVAPSIAAPVEAVAAAAPAAVAPAAVAPMKLQDYADYMTKLKNEQLLQQNPNTKFWDSSKSSWSDFLKQNAPKSWRDAANSPVYNANAGDYGKSGQTTMVDPLTGSTLGPNAGASYQFGVAYRPPGTTASGAVSAAPPSDLAALADWKKTHAWTQGPGGQIVAK